MVQMPREDLIGKVFFAGAQVPMGVPDPYAQPPVAQPPAAPGKPSCTQHEITSVVCKRLSPCLFFERHMFLFTEILNVHLKKFGFKIENRVGFRLFLNRYVGLCFCTGIFMYHRINFPNFSIPIYRIWRSPRFWCGPTTSSWIWRSRWWTGRWVCCPARRGIPEALSVLGPRIPPIQKIETFVSEQRNC